MEAGNEHQPKEKSQASAEGTMMVVETTDSNL
jgi:hypothetical protein